MSNMSNKIPGIFASPAPDLDNLENAIHAALKRTWIMLWLMLATSLGYTAYILARHLYC